MIRTENTKEVYICPRCNDVEHCNSTTDHCEHDGQIAKLHFVDYLTFERAVSENTRLRKALAVVHGGLTTDNPIVACFFCDKGDSGEPIDKFKHDKGCVAGLVRDALAESENEKEKQ